jgi:hypothetical protein
MADTSTVFPPENYHVKWNFRVLYQSTSKHQEGQNAEPPQLLQQRNVGLKIGTYSVGKYVCTVKHL